MVELGRIKIKKKAYNFSVKRRYQYAGHYKLKERPPIEKIKDAIRTFTTPKKEKKAAAVAPAGAPVPGGFNFVVFGAAIMVAFIILTLGWIYLATQLQASATVFQPPVEKPDIANGIQGGQLLTTGDRNSPTYIAAVLVNYSTQNINNYTIHITAYNAKLPSSVFVLNSERFEAESYPDFLRVLRADLAKRKIMLNEITLKELETIPEGAIILVPSGVIPQEMLGVGSPLTLDKLASRGAVVIYIGQPFNKMFNGSLVVTTPQEIMKKMTVQFDEAAQLESTDGFSLYQPLYAASAGGWGGRSAYGSVSIITKGDGAFIFVPQTLDGGWRGNFTSAADDISRVIFEIPWASPNQEIKTYEFTNQTAYSGQRYFFSAPFEKPAATLKVDFIGNSTTSNYPVMETLFLRLEDNSQNGLFIEKGGNVVPYNITNIKTRVNIKLREPVAAQPNMDFIISDVNGTQMQDLPQGNVDVQGDKSPDIFVYVDKGEYILSLVDDLGKTYAATYMNVVTVDIKFSYQDAKKRSIYVFDVSSPFPLSQVDVVVDKGQNGRYPFTNVENKINVDVGQYTGGETLPLGNHTFEFTAGGLKTIVPVVHARPVTMFDNPMFWVVVLLTLGIVGVGVFFARQEEIYYAIDIPDFPPVARTRIPLSPDALLGIFEKTNETYRWQNTPLTASEIKNGFKDIFIQGKPIYITDYNVEYLLEDLEKKGRVKEALGYYGRTEWEEKSKRTIGYLALMRKLRDICVNNAIPFTSIDESPEADSEITVAGQTMFVHFFEKGVDKNVLLGRSLKTISKGITIILFKSAQDKDQLQGILDSSPSVAPLIMKMEGGSGSLQFLTTDEFEKTLLDFKGM